ncbi:MAG: hypothetical protein JNJ54_12130 [Myxococcaceae bacterium]|nr:hypothetical protein [Myxococcaceae bacterium]
MLRLPVAALVSLVGPLCACQPPDMPTLEVIASPRTIDGRGGTSTISVSASRRDQVAGSGTVRLSSTAGTFKPPVTLTLDGEGKASETFTCLTANDPACVPRVTITAEWVHNGMAFAAETRVTVSAAGGGAAGGGAAGGGAAGGGAAGGGAAGGGAAGGGAAGGGAAGGGSAGGGAAGGGSAGGGSAGGGSAGGGSAGGGAAGGGSAGGSAGGGSAGGTTDAGSNLRFSAPVIDPSHVILFGTLTRNTCEGAFAQVDAGTTRPFVGVPCALEPQHASLRPDGGFVYLHPTTSRVLHAVPDALGFHSNGWLYPTNVEGNDIDLTPACTGNPTRFLLRPNGAVVAQCSNGTWMEGAATLTHLGMENIIALGRDGTAMVNRSGNVFLISNTGTQTPVATPFVPASKLTRANAAGFLSVATMPTCSLYQIANDGTVTKVGDYSTVSGIGSIAPACNGRIDATGTLFFGVTTIGGTGVVQRPLGAGPFTWVALPNMSSTVWDFGPRYNFILTDGNHLVTSP